MSQNKYFQRASKSDTWWAPLWRGLIVSQGKRHYETMRSAIWLFSYMLLHADRRSGRLIRQLDTIAKDMGIKPRTVRYWLMVLRKHGYITTKHTGRSLEITIEKWKPLQGIRARQLASLKHLMEQRGPEPIAKLPKRRDRVIRRSK